ncbi:MAG TPA: UbiA family prenyltransferase, partial [Sedimentisphaerales bacterium]|nr:UbiA family prenyltransferase [Sedimentisphaerales bacterium]
MRFLRLMRPSHWTKNVFVFAALVFGQRSSGTAEEVLVAVSSAIGGFVCFCLASSAIYIFNDIIDRDADRSHPEKRRRPIASGAVGVGSAAALSVICAVGGIGG